MDKVKSRRSSVINDSRDKGKKKEPRKVEQESEAENEEETFEQQEA